jgi:hypothetical protein
MFDDKDDIKLTDTKSTKLDAERSKREDSNEQDEGCVCEEIGNCHCQPCE